MNQWWNDSNLRTARSMREAGLSGDLHSQRQDEKKILHFMAGFSLGVLGSVYLILLKVLP
jgi:hypothetical protein